MKNKLLVQVGIITTLFLAAVLVAVEILLTMISRTIYLNEKNDMIERDLEVTVGNFKSVSSHLSLFRYFLENQDLIKHRMTVEEYAQFYNEEGTWSDEAASLGLNTTDEEFAALTPELKRFFAETYYDVFYVTLGVRMRNFNYEQLYLLDVDENGNATVIIKGSIDTENVDATALGEAPEIGVTGSGVLKQLCYDDDTAIRFEILESSNGNAYYAGYHLVGVSGTHHYVIVEFYNWNEFRNNLINMILPVTLISAVVILFANVLMIRFLDIRVVKPATRIQKNVREYTDTKDTDHVVSELTGIVSENELGSLANDIVFLAKEMQRYTTDNMRLAAEQERVTTELELAAKIQLSALPSKFPAFPERGEFGLYASMTPAKKVGGDFYDFFLIDEDRLALVIADVSGKGVPAALFMMSSKMLISSYALLGGTPAETLTAVNDRVCENNEDNMFVTVWLGILEISTGRITCCNAGHEYPAIKRAGGGFELVNDKHGLFVGTMPGIRYSDYEIQLGKGDTLFVYTDGVPEATNAAEELFGNERMITALNSAPKGCPLDELLHTVKEHVDGFVGDAPQFDDLTMLAIRYDGK